MKKILIILLLMTACSAKERKEIQAETFDPWVVVGEKSGCTLYYRVHDGISVYWSICYNGGNVNSSVSR